MRVMGAEMLAPLREALGEAMVLLEKARAEPPTDVGLARLATDQYAAWPADADELVPARFAEANNEVLLISSSAFKGRYEIDLPKAVAGASAMMPLRTAIDDATTRAILGHWRTTGGVSAPGVLIERTATWVTRALGTDPETRRPPVCRRWRGSTYTPVQQSCWRGPASLWAGRAKRSRSSARCRCATSCRAPGPRNRSWLPAAAISPRSSPRRCRSPARWPASNDEALQRVHPGQQTEYRYKFSEVPFAGQPGCRRAVRSAAQQPAISTRPPRTTTTESLSDEDSVTRVDIFGSYPNYSPLAFDSVLKPAAQQWARIAGPGRGTFWRYRRARPLAGIPADDRRRAPRHDRGVVPGPDRRADSDSGAALHRSGAASMTPMPGAG